MSEVEVVSDAMAVNLTEGEKALLTPEQLKRWQDRIDRSVFGDDFKRDPATGKPVEQGIGSKGNETLNHYKALRAAELRGDEAPGTSAKAEAELWARDPKRAKAIGLVPSSYAPPA